MNYIFTTRRNGLTTALNNQILFGRVEQSNVIDYEGSSTTYNNVNIDLTKPVHIVLHDLDFSMSNYSDKVANILRSAKMDSNVNIYSIIESPVSYKLASLYFSAPKVYSELYNIINKYSYNIANKFDFMETIIDKQYEIEFLQEKKISYNMIVALTKSLLFRFGFVNKFKSINEYRHVYDSGVLNGDKEVYFNDVLDYFKGKYRSDYEYYTSKRNNYYRGIDTYKDNIIFETIIQDKMRIDHDMIFGDIGINRSIKVRNISNSFL